MLASDAADDAAESHIYRGRIEGRSYNKKRSLHDVDTDVVGVVVSRCSSYVTHDFA